MTTTRHVSSSFVRAEDPRRAAVRGIKTSSRRVLVVCLLGGCFAACSQPTLWLGKGAGVDSGEGHAVHGAHGAHAGSASLAAVGGGRDSALASGGRAADVGGAGGKVAAALDAGALVSAGGTGSPPPATGGAAGSGRDVDDPHAALDAGPRDDPTRPSGADDAGEADDDSDEPLAPSQLPAATRRCPTLAGNGTYTFGVPGSRSLLVDIYIADDARDKPAPGGPLVMYWHALGSDASEVMRGLGRSAIDAITKQGGVVAAFRAKLCATCGLAEDAVWYAEDDDVSDHLVACALEQARIDTRRIHSVGFSAGGLHSLHLAVARSSYVASVVSYSGGLVDPAATPEPEDPSNHVASLLSYGAPGVDTAGFDFSVLSHQWYDAYRPLGWYIMMCEHAGGHEIPAPLAAVAYRFLLDHPYKVSPEPYAKAIPGDYPGYCKNTPPPP
ncbi:MAG: hypothetical protein ABW321_18420 [Polyangiales bacterium]